MNSAAEKLDPFLQEADPDAARMVEEYVQSLISHHTFEQKPTFHPAFVRPLGKPSKYRLPVRKLGALPSLDLTKLAHADEDE